MLPVIPNIFVVENQTTTWPNLHRTPTGMAAGILNQSEVEDVIQGKKWPHQVGT